MTYQDRQDRQNFFERHAFLPLNDFFAFDIIEGEARLHLAPARLETSSVLRLKFVEAMQNLANILEEKDGVIEVTATSWIVARVPRLVTQFGFIIEGKIDDNEQKFWFPGETRTVYRARIGRKEFISMFTERKYP